MLMRLTCSVQGSGQQNQELTERCDEMLLELVASLFKAFVSCTPEKLESAGCRSAEKASSIHRILLLKIA